MSDKKTLPEAVVNALVESLQGFLKRAQEIRRSWEELPTEVKAELELSPEALNRLPWRLYREGHRDAWIFADTEGVEKLVGLIRESPTGKIPIGEFEYKISHGRDREFVSRNPIEK